MLERDDDGSGAETAADFDAYVITERAERADPCKDLAKQLHVPQTRIINHEVHRLHPWRPSEGDE